MKRHEIKTEGEDRLLVGEGWGQPDRVGFALENGGGSVIADLTPAEAREVAIWLAEHANRIDPPKRVRGQSAEQAEG